MQSQERTKANVCDARVENQRGAVIAWRGVWHILPHYGQPSQGCFGPSWTTLIRILAAAFQDARQAHCYALQHSTTVTHLAQGDSQRRGYSQEHTNPAAHQQLPSQRRAVHTSMTALPMACRRLHAEAVVQHRPATMHEHAHMLQATCLPILGLESQEGCNRHPYAVDGHDDVGASGARRAQHCEIPHEPWHSRWHSAFAYVRRSNAVQLVVKACIGMILAQISRQHVILVADVHSAIGAYDSEHELC
jgi:hypothetical protein